MSSASTKQSEDSSQFFQPLSDPLFPVRVISSGSAIFPTEKRATHAAIDQMKRLNLVFRTNLRSLHPRHCLFLWLQTNFPLPSPQSHDRKSNCPQHFRLQGGWHRFLEKTDLILRGLLSASRLPPCTLRAPCAARCLPRFDQRTASHCAIFAVRDTLRSTTLLRIAIPVPNSIGPDPFVIPPLLFFKVRIVNLH